MNHSLVIAMAVLAILLIVLVPMAYYRPAWPPAVAESFSDATDAYQAGARATYIDQGKALYNKFSDTNDIQRGNFLHVEDPAGLKAGNQALQDVMGTSGLEPSETSETYLGILRDVVSSQLSPNSGVLKETKKCEALKGRGACAVLGTPGFQNCGVCIKGGTTHTGRDEGKHIGGLLIIPDDKADAIANRTPFQPTVGNCPEGYFFLDKETCKKEARRASCTEIGESGGFTGGKTAEGVAWSPSIGCAQVPVSGNSFVYKPAEAFDAVLRVLAPTGTGACKVWIKNGAGTLVGYGESLKPGVEFTVPVKKVKELMELTITVALETPQRSKGKSEVFLFETNLLGTSSADYNQTQESGWKVCDRIRTSQASKRELFASMNSGAQNCATGVLMDGVGFPMQGQSKTPGCGTKGFNSWGSDGGTRGHTWCYGIKPPQSTNQTGFFTKVFPFFTTQNDMSPSQADQPTTWSQHGADYQAPFQRGILMQWEMADMGMNRRTAAFEPSIVSINGMGPNTVSSDGVATFKILRRLGTYAKSSIIVGPRPTGSSRMLTNQFWIWSNQATDQVVTFGVKVPGTLADPTYYEDTVKMPRGPLLSDPKTAALLRTSPCLKDGQVAGKYSGACLTSLFQSAGGDPSKGKLATENGGLQQLNKRGDLDAIAAYLSNLYTIATTGRDTNGNEVGRDSRSKIAAINSAAQLLFGFDIANPCEDIGQDAQGNLVLTPKKGVLDAWCLDYLWTNTGSDKGREEAVRTGGLEALAPTYVLIGDRFSGLKSKEATAAARSATPFATCQRSGTMAPVSASGKPNQAVINKTNADAMKLPLKNGSIVQTVQDAYATIHLFANGTPGNNELIEACYGLTKATDKLASCGVQARYVRVLPSGVYASGDRGNLCIQIPQLQVFDGTGAEVAKGKATQAYNTGYGGVKEFAVNGNAKNHSHGEGEYHSSCNGPDYEFWMVDLGKMTDVAMVKFFFRTDCCTQRQLAAPVQLLDASKRIVAQRYLGETTFPGTWGNAESLAFKKSDAIPAMPISSLVPGKKVSLMSATSWDRYLRHASFAFWVSSFNPKAPDGLLMSDATFMLSAPNNGRAGYVSFQSVNFPNYFLRHSGYRVYLHTKAGDPTYQADSSFKIVPALNGDPTMVSLQSSNFPTMYVSVHRNSPGEVWITTVDTGNPWDVQRASWRVKAPLRP